jgi:ADP-heptose:LPS heptosyltransferase
MISFQNKNIAIFRALQLGDMLCAIPAIRALKTAYPDSRLTLIGLPWAASLVNRFPQYFDSFIHFPGYPGLPEQPYDDSKYQSFKEDMKAAAFDFILQMQGNGTIVNDMLQELNAGNVMGYTLNDKAFGNNAFLLYPNYGHEINRHLKLMEHLGITSLGPDLEFPASALDETELQQLQLPIKENKYVCIHPGSRGAWRQWPTAHFAALGDLCANAGLVVVITGTAAEAEIVADVIEKMQCQAINLAGKTSLGAIGKLIGEASILIANCTGVSHIAAALKTPSVVISMDGEPERWAPLNTDLHYTIDWTQNPDFDTVCSKTKALLTNIRHAD